MVNIRQLREARGLKQNELATTIGVSQQLLSMIENGNRQPSVATAQKIAKVLGFDWTEFFDRKEEPA